MTKKNDELIETFDEDGNKVVFEMLDIVTVDDVEYALLLPQCDDECECEEHNHEEPEVLVMRLKKDGEEYSFEEIEDDDEFNKVAEYIENIEDEIDE